jgi:hypothetical protein
MSLRSLTTLMTAASLFVSMMIAGYSGAPAQPSSQTDDTAYVEIKTEKFEGVIVPAARAAEFVKSLTGYEGKGHWTPGREDVFKFEARIEAHLRKATDKRSPALWKKLSNYRRQYAGVEVEGRKLLYANFFCDTFNGEWKNRPVAVEDGGDCFFQIKYDLHTGAFTDLQINGEA